MFDDNDQMREVMVRAEVDRVTLCWIILRVLGLIRGWIN